MTAFVVVSVVVGFWRSSSTLPVVSVPIAPAGQLFSEWEDGTVQCEWWNGTYTYSTDLCNSFAVTRLSASDVQKALDRANRCAALGTTDCVLNGEIGLAVPSAFIYDASEAGLRMLIAPRVLELDSEVQQVTVKTIRMMDPTGVHPNQLFEFNTSVRVEFLKGGSRSVETLQLTGNDAYCLQTLRRSIVPACWQALD